MRIPQEIIENKLEEVPENIRTQVTSEEVAGNLATIAQEHGLHVDQTGILNEETLYVILGIENTSNFVGRIASRIGISEAQAESIVKDINDRIFLSIRNALQTQSPAEQGPIADNRESILAEIENPSPTIHPISAADQTIAGPATAREVVSEPATNFIAQKLGTAVSTPTVKVVDRAPMPSEKPKSYAADPYREPIS